MGRGGSGNWRDQRRCQKSFLERYSFNYIQLHVGSCKGWINGAELVFQSKKSGDYHDEMTSEHFEEWFNNILIPKLEPNSIIVLDNASYHSHRLQKIPVKSSTKQEMKDWLTSNGLQFS